MIKIKRLTLNGKKYKPILCGLKLEKTTEKVLKSEEGMTCQPGYYDHIEISVVKLSSSSSADSVFEKILSSFLENVVVSITVE